MRGPFNTFDKVETAVEICEAKLGEQFSSAEDITSLPNADKAVLLIKFASGLKIKLCVFALDNYSFETNTRFMNSVGPGFFPRVLCRGNGWAAFEWIEGQTVSQQALGQEIVDQAAGLLAAIHDAKIECVPGFPETVLNEVRLKLKAKLPVLVANDVITQAHSQRVTDLCHSLSAQSLSISLIHGDFSPANLVVCGEKLYPVDNEKMRLHVTDYDACRAATFWDEWNLSGQQLLDAYSQQSGRMFAPESLFFWGIFDLVYRISYRVFELGETNKFCTMRLREIMRTGTFR